jgi:autotransporter adhesin
VHIICEIPLVQEGNHAIAPPPQTRQETHMDQKSKNQGAARTGGKTTSFRVIALAASLLGMSTTAWGFELFGGEDGTFGGVHLSNVAVAGTATAYGTAAFGVESTANADYSTAIGSKSTASAYSSTAIGRFSNASGNSSTASGNQSKAAGDFSTASGNFSDASGTGSTATGSGSLAGGVNSTAIGRDSLATGTNSVALGATSNDGGASNVVSVGSVSQTRKIINVTAGTVDATSTDAVNGTQLYSTNQAVAAAQGTANTALTNAATAQGTASTALTNAATAQGTANTAVTNFTSGTVNASFASANLNNGGVTNAGTISGVNTATAADQAVNFAQLQTVMTQLIQSGLCKVNGGTVSCGTATAGAVQMGAGATVGAGATHSVAIGNNANAQSSGGVAIGDGATAVQSNSVAIGKGAVAQSSVAVGTGAQALGTNTTALGDNATASGNFGVAVGNNAVASHTNSVALGNGSVTSAANTVSVGSAGNERRVSNVAAGVNSTDAVNVNQLNAAINSGAATTNAYTDQQISQLRRDAYRGIAQAGAMVPMTPASVGESTLNAGIANYGGESAIGLAFASQIGERVSINAGVSTSGGSTNLIRAGIGIRF